MSVQLSNAAGSAQDEIIYAVSHRFCESEDEMLIRAAAARGKVQALAPDDALEALLVGQLVALNEVFAEATHDLLNGVIDPARLKGQANLVNLARVTQGHVDRLKRMAKHPAQTGTPPTRTAAPVPERTPDEPAAAKAVTKDTALAAIAPGYERPEVLDSPLDEPFVQWLAERPADAERGQEPIQVETPPEAPPCAARPAPVSEDEVPNMVAAFLTRRLEGGAPAEAPPEAAPGD